MKKNIFFVYVAYRMTLKEVKKVRNYSLNLYVHSLYT